MSVEVVATGIQRDWVNVGLLLQKRKLEKLEVSVAENKVFLEFIKHALPHTRLHLLWREEDCNHYSQRTEIRMSRQRQM